MRTENQTLLKIVMDTFNEMPDIFTSFEFNRAALENGYPERLLRGRGLANYLRRFADNDFYRSKQWTKKGATPAVVQTKIAEETTEPKSSNIEGVSIEECIQILKNAGYKVMKPVSEWEEL